MTTIKVIITSSLISLLIIFGTFSYAAAETAKDRYFKAEAAYSALKKSETRLKYRHNWIDCIEKFQAVYKITPTDPWASAGMYMSGRLYYELYRFSGRPSDLENSVDILQLTQKQYPTSSYAIKAKAYLKDMLKNNNEVSLLMDSSSTVDSQRNYPTDNQKKEESGLFRTTTVKDVRFWSNPNYTRIVIDADQETTFTHHLLKKDPSLKKPQRLYIDLNNSKLGTGFTKVIPVDDDLLSNVRAGQFTPFSVRVVIDIKSFRDYNIFALKEPFRIVIDMEGADQSIASSSQKSKSSDSSGIKLDQNDIKDATKNLAKQLALGVRRIVIDPGHGGRDVGAPGYYKGIYEKTITLKIAQRLAKKIKEKIKCEVILTRNDDRYLTLEERTAIANTKNADLFISIHTNASYDKRAYGTQTYLLGLTKEKEAARVAAMENKTSEKNISDLEQILDSLMKNSKINESSKLARFVQRTMISKLKKKYSKINDKGIDQAPFYVLSGAKMPAILVETAFISNSRECKRLIDSSYQNLLSDALVEGIQIYIDELNNGEIK